MIDSIAAWIAETAATIREHHAVNPYVFIALSAGCGPIFYYSMYRLVKALARDRSAVGRWSLVFLVSAVVPYVYVLLFGRNLPWWVYLVLAAAIAAGVLMDNPEITVIFAPYDEFAKGVKQAAERVGAAGRVRIYSADVSDADIAAMREPESPWVATAAANPVVVGRVSVRVLAMLLAGQDPGERVVVPATLITRELLIERDIRTMADLTSRVPGFSGTAIARPDWIPVP